MKIQDLIFIAALVGLSAFKKPKAFVWAGIVCLVLAIPLFAKWVFFTAERLTWYAAAFFLIYLLFSLSHPDKVK